MPPALATFTCNFVPGRTSVTGLTRAILELREGGAKAGLNGCGATPARRRPLEPPTTSHEYSGTEDRIVMKLAPSPAAFGKSSRMMNNRFVFPAMVSVFCASVAPSARLSTMFRLAVLSEINASWEEKSWSSIVRENNKRSEGADSRGTLVKPAPDTMTNPLSAEALSMRIQPLTRETATKPVRSFAVCVTDPFRGTVMRRDTDEPPAGKLNNRTSAVIGELVGLVRISVDCNPGIFVN